MPKQHFTADYTNLELYLKDVCVEPNTEYILTMDTLGGEMELYFSNQALKDGHGGVRYIPAAEVWTPIRFSFATGKDITEFVNWGICFVKTAWVYHAYGGTYSSTYVDNVRLHKVGSDQELLLGGDFEENSSSAVYDTHWRPSVLGGTGAALGVAITEDPLNAANHCLRFPDVIKPLAYPTPLPLMAHTFGCFRGLNRDIRCIEFHGRPHPRFLLVEQGRITAKLGEQAFDLPTGSLLLLPANVPYRYTYHAGDTTVYYWLAVTGEQLQPLLEAITLSAPAALPLSNAAALTAFISAMLRLPTGRATYYYGISGQLQLFFSELERQLTADNATFKHRHLIENAASRLRRYPEIAITNAELAAECGLSENYFISLFKQHIGISPHRYRQNALMQQACKLLQDTSLTVQEISYSLGIDDPLYFSRLFRTLQGISPREYRHLRHRSHP